MKRIGLKERVAMRVLGVTISEDGSRWLASRKHAHRVEQVLVNARDEAWRRGVDATLSRLPNGDLELRTPQKTVTLRLRP